MKAAPGSTDTPAPLARVRLGLSWKIFLLIAALLTSVSAVVGALQQRLLAGESERREQERLETYPALVEALLRREREKIGLLAAQTATALDTGTPGALRVDGLRPALAAGLESVLVFDGAGRLLAQLSLTRPVDVAAQPWIAAMVGAVGREARPRSRLACREQCLHYVFAPALDAQRRELVMALAQDAAEILPAFRELGGSDIALLARDAGSARDWPRLFGRRLVAVTDAPTLGPLLAQMPTTGLPRPTLEAPVRVVLGGRRLRLATHPLDDPYDAGSVEALFILDGTAARDAIAGTLTRTAAVSAAGLLLSVAVLFLLMVPAMGRLRRVTDALPLLAAQRFDEARRLMQARPRARRLPDEIDVLGDSALWLTDRLQRLDRAEAASEAKSRFLAAMSHEIRTPMNGVLGTLELLELAGLRPDQQDSVRVIRESAQALLRVIDDILDFSKIEAGVLDIEQVPMNPSRIVEETVQTLAPALRDQAVRLVTFVDPALPETVRGDPVRLRQVLFNLCGNAIKFTARGRILVRAEPAAGATGRVRFSVRDTGTGIAPAAQQRLFQPFSQGDASTRRRYGGTGLGLSISAGLVQRMGGTIGFSSEEGRGSEFWFELPLSAEGGPPAPAPAPLRGLRVHLRLADTDENDALAAYARAAGAGLEAAPTAGAIVVEDDGSQPGAAGISVRMDGGAPESLPRPVQRRALVEALARAGGVALPGRPSAVTMATAPAATGARILVAEDHAVNRRVLREQLQRLGHAADVVEDGQQALEALGARRYDLLITDLQMPGLDGFELIREIRRREAGRPAGRSLPIVALSANVLQDEAARCRAAGADDYLSKPVSLNELGEGLARWLSAAAPEAGPPPIDLAQLQRWIGDRPGLVREVLDDFVRINQPMVAEMGEAVGRQAWPRVGELAHKLRGSAVTAGAAPLGGSLAAAEAAARAGDPEAASAAMAQVQRDFDAARDWIKALGSTAAGAVSR